MMDYNAQVKHWDDIQIGDVSTFSKTMTETDMILWVGLTGDMNPVHIDKEYGKTTRFKDVIVPGLLVAGLISTVMTKATFGNVYSGQTLKFLKPVYVGDTITAVATWWTSWRRSTAPSSKPSASTREASWSSSVRARSTSCNCFLR